MTHEHSSDTETTPTETITIDGQRTGRTFDGVGGISAGASSRLLYDYPEPERSDILDYLFEPGYGAALQILKVEIGGDINSTDGSEPSHMRTPGDLNCDRGYEWWLMREAKQRNPEIKLAGLEWGAPGWFDGGFWSQDNIDYLLAWLECAKKHGLDIDYMGGWNERGYDADWFIEFDEALTERYPEVKLIAADAVRDPWAIATEMTDNPALNRAIDVVGEHSPCGWRTRYRDCASSDDARSLDQPLWNSEHSSLSHDVGAKPLARAMNRLYIDGQITGNLCWSLVSAWYASLPIADTGLLLAEWPWSGYYDVGKSIWVYAHTAQFTDPGWTYIDSACDFTGAGASYVTLQSPDENDYTTVIETVDAEDPQTVEISVTGGLSTGDVQVWATDLTSDTDQDHFVYEGTIEPRNGSFSVTVQPGHVYTLSTTSGQSKGTARPTAGPAAQMSVPFREDFEEYDTGQLARYFSDINGAFETAPCGGDRDGTCYRQVVTQQPIVWMDKRNMMPTTLVGDPRWWGDYRVSCDVFLEGPGSVELLGRVASQHDMDIIGYHLRVDDTGEWSLYSQEQNETDELASGTVPFGVKSWHQLALRMEGSRIEVAIDDERVATVEDTRHTTGQTGLRVGSWQNAQFDTVEVVPTGPWPDFVPHDEMTVTATSEHPDNHRGYVYTAANAIDDRPETVWHTEWEPHAALPQSITLDLGRSRDIEALTYQPRLDGNTDGMITEYTIYLSDDGETFTEVASGTWPMSMATKIASWSDQRNHRQARYVRLEATDGGGGFASAGEINVVRAGKRSSIGGQ